MVLFINHSFITLPIFDIVQFNTSFTLIVCALNPIYSLLFYLFSFFFINYVILLLIIVSITLPITVLLFSWFRRGNYSKLVDCFLSCFFSMVFLSLLLNRLFSVVFSVNCLFIIPFIILLRGWYFIGCLLSILLVCVDLHYLFRLSFLFFTYYLSSYYFSYFRIIHW
jgi:hypothetical protein